MSIYEEMDAERRDAFAAAVGKRWDGLAWWMLGNPPRTTDICDHYRVRQSGTGLLRVSRIRPLVPVEMHRSSNCIETDYLLHPEELGQLLGGN